MVGFFFGLTFIGGGFLSFIASRLVARLDRNKVNIILVGIVFILTGTSSLMVIVNMILGYISFGQ